MSAGGQFQSPLEEGTDVIISSTHKTMAGPQGGMVLTNDRLIAERIGPAIAPLLESNHHLSRLPALAATFLEWNEFGTEHATAIVKNAKALGQALADRGLSLDGSLVADCIVDALKGDEPGTVKQRVIDLVKRLDQFRFTITPES